MQVPPPSAETPLLRASVGMRFVLMAQLAVLSVAFAAGGVAIALFTENWGWGLGILAFFGGGAALVFVPAVAFAGRYQLTTERLVFRPFFRRGVREIRLAEIAPGDVDADAQGASIRLKRFGLRMSGLGKFHELWGALVLGGELARLPRTEGAPGFVIGQSWPGPARGTWSAPGSPRVAGVIVLGRETVAFVPDTFVVRRSVARRAGELAVGLGLAMAGVMVMRMPARPPVGAFLAHAAGVSQGYYDAVVARAAEVLGGVVVPRGAARLDARPLSPTRTELTVATPEGPLVALLDPAMAAWVLHAARATEAALRGGPTG